jgi:hypothetical protein
MPKYYTQQDVTPKIKVEMAVMVDKAHPYTIFVDRS